MSISRRHFLGTAALAGAASTALGARSTKLPVRELGRTGEKVSILAFGCGSRFLMYPDDDKGAEALNRAIDLGITYVDTAYGYGDGKSETRVGKVLGAGGRRKEVFLATKVNARKYDDAMRIIEGSLKRLQTDQVDLLHIHQLQSEEDLKNIEAEDGVLKAIYKARDQKMTRFIGITCHADPHALRAALERHDFDCTQMALNAALAGMKNVPRGMEANRFSLNESFQSVALPVANRKKMGVIAMKVFAQEQILNRAPVDKLLSYSLSLPVTAAVAGMPQLEHISENVRIAKNFKPMHKDEMRELSASIAGQSKLALDRFFRDHMDS